MPITLLPQRYRAIPEQRTVVLVQPARILLGEPLTRYEHIPDLLYHCKDARSDLHSSCGAFSRYLTRARAECFAQNIAVIKYWGKREPLELILPTNSSLSVTLSQDHLRSKTTIRAEASFDKDRLWLNGDEEEVQSTGRMANCLREMRALRKELEQQKGIKEDKVAFLCFSLYLSNALNSLCQVSDCTSYQKTTFQQQQDWLHPRQASQHS